MKKKLLKKLYNNMEYIWWDIARLQQQEKIRELSPVENEDLLNAEGQLAAFMTVYNYFLPPSEHVTRDHIAKTILLTSQRLKEERESENV